MMLCVDGSLVCCISICHDIVKLKFDDAEKSEFSVTKKQSLWIPFIAMF